MSQTIEREVQSHPSNPLGVDGIEFIEYATSCPQALGQVLEMMGFLPIARHRSREVLLYRQGAMNVVINAHDAARPGSVVPNEKPVIAQYCSVRAIWPRIAVVATRPRADAWHEPRRCWEPALG